MNDPLRVFLHLCGKADEITAKDPPEIVKITRFYPEKGNVAVRFAFPDGFVVTYTFLQPRHEKLICDGLITRSYNLTAAGRALLQKDKDDD